MTYSDHSSLQVTRYVVATRPGTSPIIQSTILEHVDRSIDPGGRSFTSRSSQVKERSIAGFVDLYSGEFGEAVLDLIVMWRCTDHVRDVSAWFEWPGAVAEEWELTSCLGSSCGMCNSPVLLIYSGQTIGQMIGPFPSGTGLQGFDNSAHQLCGSAGYSARKARFCVKAVAALIKFIMTNHGRCLAFDFSLEWDISKTEKGLHSNCQIQPSPRGWLPSPRGCIFQSC